MQAPCAVLGVRVVRPLCKGDRQSLAGPAQLPPGRNAHLVVQGQVGHGALHDVRLPALSPRQRRQAQQQRGEGHRPAERENTVCASPCPNAAPRSPAGPSQLPAGSAGCGTPHRLSGGIGRPGRRYPPRTRPTGQRGTCWPAGRAQSRTRHGPPRRPGQTAPWHPGPNPGSSRSGRSSRNRRSPPRPWPRPPTPAPPRLPRPMTRGTDFRRDKTIRSPGASRTPDTHSDRCPAPRRPSSSLGRRAHCPPSAADVPRGRSTRPPAARHIVSGPHPGNRPTPPGMRPRQPPRPAMPPTSRCAPDA